MKRLSITIGAAFLVACTLWLGVGCGRKDETVHNTLPPGWGLETDGERWRWVQPDGSTWLPLRTRERAIANAWEHYEDREPDWKRVETPNSPICVKTDSRNATTERE